MVFDESCRVETDPWKELREVLEGHEFMPTLYKSRG